jgi:hypothetical protein
MTFAAAITESAILNRPLHLCFSVCCEAIDTLPEREPLLGRCFPTTAIHGSRPMLDGQNLLPANNSICMSTQIATTAAVRADYAWDR